MLRPGGRIVFAEPNAINPQLRAAVPRQGACASASASRRTSWRSRAGAPARPLAGAGFADVERDAVRLPAPVDAAGAGRDRRPRLAPARARAAGAGDRGLAADPRAAALSARSRPPCSRPSPSSGCRPHGSPALTWLLSVVSLLGYSSVYVVLLLGAGLRRAPATEPRRDRRRDPGRAFWWRASRRGVALPRPDEVDSRVRSGAQGPPVALVERGGAPDFWSLPRPEAIAAVRARAQHNYGFPSGHVACCDRGPARQSRSSSARGGRWPSPSSGCRRWRCPGCTWAGTSWRTCSAASPWASWPWPSPSRSCACSNGPPSRAAAAAAVALVCLLAAASLGLAPFASLLPSLFLGCLAGVLARLRLPVPHRSAAGGRQRPAAGRPRRPGRSSIFALGAAGVRGAAGRRPWLAPGPARRRAGRDDGDARRHDRARPPAQACHG